MCSVKWPDISEEVSRRFVIVDEWERGSSAQEVCIPFRPLTRPATLQPFSLYSYRGMLNDA